VPENYPLRPELTRPHPFSFLPLTYTPDYQSKPATYLDVITPILSDKQRSNFMSVALQNDLMAGGLPVDD